MDLDLRVSLLLGIIASEIHVSRFSRSVAKNAADQEMM